MSMSIEDFTEKFGLLFETQEPKVIEGMCIALLLVADPDPELRMKLLSTGAYLTATRRISEDSAFKTVQLLMKTTPEEQHELISNLKEMMKGDSIG